MTGSTGYHDFKPNPNNRCEICGHVASASWHYVKGSIVAGLEAENAALRKWQANVTVALRNPGGAFFEDVPKHIKAMVDTLEALRSLLSLSPDADLEGAIRGLQGRATTTALSEMLAWMTEHRESHVSWLRHFEADPDGTCGRCTPELIRSVGNADDQRATIARYDRMIDTVTRLMADQKPEAAKGQADADAAALREALTGLLALAENLTDSPVIRRDGIYTGQSRELVAALASARRAVEGPEDCECDQCGTKSRDWNTPKRTLRDGDSCPRHYLDDDSCDGIMRAVAGEGTDGGGR
jgi:hypothetical protein